MKKYNQPLVIVDIQRSHRDGELEDEALAQSRRQEMEDQESLLSEKMGDLSISETIGGKMNHLFPRKRDWILVEEIQTTGLPSIYCLLCGEHISVPYYAAKEEDKEEPTPIGHKVCCDLPMEMEHHLLHPGHTLRKTRSGFGGDDGSIQFCNTCDNEMTFGGKSYYKCSDCEEFVLGIICALKLFPINHKCHHHPLIPIHEKEDFLCNACRMNYAGISYECTTCPSFRVHQYCVSPRTVKLPSHRHDLRLIYSLSQSHFGEPIYCHICRQDLEGQSFAYHCARCRYFFHTYNCRLIKHFSLDGPLVLVEEGGGARAESESAKCVCCQLKISVPYYVSTYRQSDVLHKFCAKLPDRVHHHHLHPGKELTLGKSKRMCDACRAPWRGLSYFCRLPSCRFSIDIICALKNVHSHRNFHQHPLTVSHTKGPLACHACHIDSDGPSYKCTTCRFWVHHQCGSAPMSRKHDMHPHMLKLTYSIQDSAPEDGGRKYHCHVCRKEMQPHDWAYHCAGCKYYIHAHDCYDPPWSREIEEFDYEAALAAAVRLPPVDSEPVSLATLFFMDTSKEEDRELKPGTQDADGIKVGKTLFLDPDETCHMCAELLAPPCNNCALCNYFLPKSPAELNDRDSLISGYYSMLRAGPNKINYNLFGMNNCNGFGMSFSKDGLRVKISSSVLPRYVKHEGHRHVLLTTFLTEKTWCSACEGDVQGYAFRCNLCNFTIDTYCAMLPGSVRHRYDKKHPFKLTYYSIEGVQEYVCELCEKDITTMWFYHCAACDHSIHPRCIWRYFINFGPSIDAGRGYEKSEGETFLVPTTKVLPLKCLTCGQGETTGCRYSTVYFSSRYVVNSHLGCKGVPKYERWSEEREELVNLLFSLRRKAMFGS